MTCSIVYLRSRGVVSRAAPWGNTLKGVVIVKVDIKKDEFVLVAKFLGIWPDKGNIVLVGEMKNGAVVKCTVTPRKIGEE